MWQECSKVSKVFFFFFNLHFTFSITGAGPLTNSPFSPLFTASSSKCDARLKCASAETDASLEPPRACSEGGGGTNEGIFGSGE